MRYEILSKIRYEIQSEITRLIRIVIFKYDKCRILTVYFKASLNISIRVKGVLCRATSIAKKLPQARGQEGKRGDVKHMCN